MIKTIVAGMFMCSCVATAQVSIVVNGPLEVGSENIKAPLIQPTTRALFEVPIEAPSIIVQSVSNGVGIGIAAADDGKLVSFVAHQSPYFSEVARSNMLVAIDQHKAKRRALTTHSEKLGKGQLQNRIEAIEAWIRLQDQ